MPDCGSSPCPKCNASSPCVDHIEVDIGIGIQAGDHQYWCKTHGLFGWSSSGDVVFQDDAEFDEEAARKRTETMEF